MTVAAACVIAGPPELDLAGDHIEVARRYLPGGPFNAPVPLAETFAIHDQVTTVLLA